METETKTTTKTKESKIAKVLLECMRKKYTIDRLARHIGRSIAETSRMLNSLARTKPALKQVFENLNWPLNISSGHIFLGSFSTSMAPDDAKKRELNNKIKNLISRGQKFSRKNEKSLSTRLKFAQYIKKLEQQIKDLPLIVGGSMVHGVRVGTLKPGDHVFAKPIRGKRYSEIFLAEQEIQFLIYLGYNDKAGQFQKLDSNGNPFGEIWVSKQDINSGNLKKIVKNKSTKATAIKISKKTRISYSPGHWQGIDESRNLVSVNNDWK